MTGSNSQSSGFQLKPRLEEFLFGDPDGRHMVLSAIDRSQAVWRFCQEASSMKDFVPEKYLMGGLGFYDAHAEIFVSQYAPDACVPVFIKDCGVWKPIEGIPFQTGR